MARILVADTDARLREVVRATLEAYGHEVLEGPDVNSVAKHLAHGRVDAFLLGHMGPRLANLRLLKKIREKPRHRRLPVCLIAPNPAEMAQRLTRQAVAVDVLLAQPFATQDLSEAVQILLGRDANQFVHFGRPKRISLPPGTAPSRAS